MDSSIFLTELWGITIAVVSLALLIKPNSLKCLFLEAKNEATMFIWGVVTLAIGIAMVLAHNVWVLDWRVVITILGWLTLLKGLDLLFFPERMNKRWQKMEKRQRLLVFTSMFFFGLALTYLGFAA